MTTEEATRYLCRYQKWRRGEDERTFDETGLNPTGIGTAIDILLAEATVRSREIASLQSRLSKCQVDRERFHSQLRRQKKVDG